MFGQLSGPGQEQTTQIWYGIFGESPRFAGGHTERKGTVAATSAAAAHHHMVSNAIKACGTVITVGPFEFLTILAKTDDPLVVCSEGGLFTKHFKYLTSYRGLAFYCKSPAPLEIPRGAEVIAAHKIAIPDL